MRARFYRAMQPDADGRPVVGSGPSMLGVRVGTDVRPDAVGLVAPSRGGMSVTPDDPRGLPPHFRPKPLGGFGRLPVYGMAVHGLPGLLTFRRDPRKPSHHGFVEPSQAMLLDAYQAALASTKPVWEEYVP